jgi:pimeloyl-ACP methyl ester carboxylesterase
MPPLSNAAPLTGRPQRVKRGLPAWLKRGLLGLLALIVLLPLAGALIQTLGTALDQRANPPPGQLIDISGYSLHLDCQGESAPGEPTVILEHGLGATSAAWARVQPEVAKVVRVCAYDRAGMGWSDPSPQPRDAQHIAAELHSLLQAGGIPGPYVLVGWSFGGLYSRMYAGSYPDEVAGVVLLDSSHPDQWTSTSAGQAQFESNAGIYKVAPWLARLGVMRLMGLFQADPGLPLPQNDAHKAFFVATNDWDAQSAEFLASPVTNDQVRSLGPLGALPLFVLSATVHGTPPEQEALWEGWQKELALLSTNSVHQVVAGANHAAFWREPDGVKASVEAILRVVEAARTGETLRP